MSPILYNFLISSLLMFRQNKLDNLPLTKHGNRSHNLLTYSISGSKHTVMNEMLASITNGLAYSARASPKKGKGFRRFACVWLILMRKRNLGGKKAKLIWRGNEYDQGPILQKLSMPVKITTTLVGLSISDTSSPLV